MEEKAGKSLKLMGMGINVINRSPIAQTLTSKFINGPQKVKNFYKTKGIANRTNWQATYSEIMFTNSPSNARLISKIYKEFK